MERYVTFEPGVYQDFEKEAVEKRFAQARGELEIPAWGPPMAPRPITEAEIIAHNSLYNPYDPLYNDPEYARAHGHPGVPAMPGFHARAAGAVEGMDKNVGDEFIYTNDGTAVEQYQNIYAGMILTTANAKADFRDETTPGANIRRFFNGGESDCVDQNGTVIYHAKGNTRDCYRKLNDPKEYRGFAASGAKWTAYFPPAHVTTDEDYQRIYEIWDNEVINGDNTPYWEDVDIGFELPKVCSEGPITYMHLIAWHNMGTRSLFNREELRDLELMKQIYFQDPNGAFLDETAIHYGGRNLVGSRMVFYNNTAANLIYRCLTNFVGNKGRVSKYSWRFYPFFEDMRCGPLCADMFNKIPGMEGRDCDRHGAEGDTVIGRAVVTDKYVNARGEHCCEVMLWGETLDGDIIQGCPSEIVLPSRAD